MGTSPTPLPSPPGEGQKGNRTGVNVLEPFSIQAYLHLGVPIDGQTYRRYALVTKLLVTMSHHHNKGTTVTDLQVSR